jgi:hypothetical protein
MPSVSRAIAAKKISVLVTVAMTAAFASPAFADPSVSSDPTSLSQPTNRIVAYYLRPGAGDLMKVNQTATIGGGVSSYTVGVWALFNVQRVGMVKYCEFCPSQPYPTEQSFQGNYMEDGTLDATGTPGQGIFTLPAVDANGNQLGSTVGQVVSNLLGPPWAADRDARLAADQAVVNGPLPQMGTDVPPVDGSAYGLGALIVPVASLTPWASRCMTLGASAAGIAGGIVLLHREIWRGGDQNKMALKRTAVFGAYVIGAATLLAQWLACNAEANNLATAAANAAGATYCAPLGPDPAVYAACVLSVSGELYPSFRGALTAVLVAYTGALVGTFMAAGVYFGF